MHRRLAPRSVRASLARGAVFAAALVLVATSAFAQDTITFGRIGALGDVTESKTPNRGMVHVNGKLSIDTADYFRGAFDDVPESLDQLVIGPDLGVTFELWRARAGVLRDLSLTVGTQNGFADQVQRTDSQNEWWYESNNYAGFAARLGGDWLLGATYTIYASPNDVSPTFQEAALAVKWGGRIAGLSLDPQVKVAIPLDRQNAAFQTGVFTQLKLAPSVPLLGDALTLKFPLAVGVGLDGYYGPNDDMSAYGSAGVALSIPLRFISSQYGAWALSLGADAIVRDDDIRRLSTFDRDDTVVILGSAALSFTY